ncbi:MAG TPA: hypothetical protein VK433_05460 [Stellaceae bacterium]|nr:hypothetical protein [Stellaceae bacterium]
MTSQVRQAEGAAKAYWKSSGALVREDGVVLRREASPVAGKLRLRYVDSDVALDLFADRAVAAGEVGDIWRVDLATAFRGLPEWKRSLMSVAKLQEIAGNIRDALLAWPPTPAGDHAPIAEVTFG